MKLKEDSHLAMFAQKVYKLFVQQSRVDVRKYFFCNRVVKIWNSLPATIEDFASIGMFKGLINCVDLSQHVKF